MSNQTSAVQRIYDECKNENPDLNKIDEYIKECRSKNEDMNAFIHIWWEDLNILQLACSRGHHEIVERLLDSTNNFTNSVDVNIIVRDSNYQIKAFTALYYACKRCCALTVRKLLQHPNIDVNKSDSQNSTPLHHACSGNSHCTWDGDRKAIVIELLKHRDIQLTLKDKSGRIPLHNACRHQNEDADNIQMMIGYQQQKYRIEQLNAMDNKRRTPLHVACLSGWNAAVVEILKHEADIDINASDVDGQTPLHDVTMSQEYNIDSITVSILKKLLEQPSIMIYKKNNNGKTPLDIVKKNLGKSMWDNQKQCLNEILQLFDDYHVRQRWLVYCYLITYDLIVKEQPRNIYNCDTRRRLLKKRKE